MVVEIERDDAMQPMRVTAHLRGQVLTIDGRMALDGLLEWSAWMALPDADRDGLPDPNLVADPTNFRIPLAKWRWGEHWGWCASLGRARWYAADTRAIRQRTPVDEMIEYVSETGRIETGAGRYKSYDLPIPSRVTDRVQWCAVGHPDAVRAMLHTIPAIGKKHNIGGGTVLHWEVEPIRADWSLVWRGEPMRALPVGFPGVSPSKADVEIGAYRAPYWHRARRCEVWLPRGLV